MDNKQTFEGENHQVNVKSNTLLSDLQWTAAFRVDECRQILIKSALKQGNKIGAYNPLGSVIFLESDLEVIEVQQP